MMIVEKKKKVEARRASFWNANRYMIKSDEDRTNKTEQNRER